MIFKSVFAAIVFFVMTNASFGQTEICHPWYGCQPVNPSPDPIHPTEDHCGGWGCPDDFDNPAPFSPDSNLEQHPHFKLASCIATQIKLQHGGGFALEKIVNDVYPFFYYYDLGKALPSGPPYGVRFELEYDVDYWGPSHQQLQLKNSRVPWKTINVSACSAL